MPITPDVTVVMVTRDRRERTLASVERLCELPERPPIILIDNASSDGTADAVERRYASVSVVRLGRNLGAAGRNVGVERARTPFVAFSDDDSWWARGSLARAAELLNGHPNVATIAARVLVGPEERVDPLCAELASSPLAHRHPDSPGTAVLGFVACGAIVRRAPFLAVGGFSPRFGVGGEEELFSIDVATAGWDLSYVDEVVAHHHPARASGRADRRIVQTRNAIWTAWLRLPFATAARRTARLVDVHDGASFAGLAQAVGGLPWVLRGRRVAAPAVLGSLAILEVIPRTVPTPRASASSGPSA